MKESAASVTIVIIYNKDNNYNKGGADGREDGSNDGDSGCLMSNVVDVGGLAVDPSQWFAPETAMAMMAITKTTILPC
jgi:hypothetical protein